MHPELPIISIDGVELREFDYIDIGELIPTSGAVPVVIKSLVFPPTAHVSPVFALSFRPVGSPSAKRWLRPIVKDRTQLLPRLPRARDPSPPAITRCLAAT